MIETLQEWAQNPLFHRWEGGLWQNTVTTLYMTGVTMALTVLLGLPLGIALFETDGSASPMVRTINQIVGFVVNVLRRSEERRVGRERGARWGRGRARGQ